MERTDAWANRRLFTLAEANAMLPEVRPLLEELSEARHALGLVQGTLIEMTPEMRGNGHRVDALGLERQLEMLVDRLALGIHQIELMGITLQDIDLGLIDFPASYDGRVVLLCWRLGEEEIGYWHELSTGYAGRRPVSDLL
jgi:hypothetical protein